VLLADDHAPNRAVLVDLLAPLGFELAEAENGREALARAAEFRPDLVLMDLRMPLLDGLSATRLLRQGAAAPVVIGVSASAHEEQQRAALAAGCAAFLAKPFRHEDLLAAVGRHLGLAWRHADAPSGETTAPFPALPHAPAPAEADALFELASKGDVMGVRAYAAELAARDPRLAAFSQSVTDLAARFRMKAIRQFVDRYRHPAPPA
jgi:CheY-like chemotaxis protein